MEREKLKNYRLKFNKSKKYSILLSLLLLTSIIINFSAVASDNFSYKWTCDYGYTSYSSPVTKDINGDGIHEIFIAGKNDTRNIGGIVAINGSNGNILWTEEFSSLKDCHVPCAIADLDNDGTYEIVHAAGSRTIARNCEDGSIFWDVATPSGWSQLAIADVDDNNYPYVFTGSNTGYESSPKVRKLYGTNGTVAASENIRYCCFGGVSIADLDRDGEFEIVISDSPSGGGSNVMDEDLNTLWQTGSYTQESHCAVLANVTGDGNLEVIILDQSSAGVENGGIHVYYANGTLVPGKSSSDLDLTCHCQPSVYDIDKDGNLELATAFNGEIKIWDLTNWCLDATLEMGSEPPNFENVIGDSDLEIVSPCAWVDAKSDIYNDSYTHIDQIYSYGINTVTQDIDNDGKNELLITNAGTITVYDTLAIASIPRVRTDTPHYSERRTSAAYYIPAIGGKCSITNPIPSESATDISISTSIISVNINEPTGDIIDWTLETSPNIGSSSGTGESNGTKTCSISGLSYGTTYTWYVNATDGTNWRCESYSFTTENEGESYNGPDYYVDDSSGNDINNGSLESPWKTIQHAVNTVNIGDTVYIMEGIYNEKQISTWGSNSGTTNNWITYTNYQNDQVIIDGTGDYGSWDGIFWIDGLSYIRISNLTFRNASCHGILVEDGSGPVSNIIIDNCIFYNCSESGINFLSSNGQMSDIKVKNNTIYNCCNGWLDTPSQECITLKNCHNFEIFNNKLFDNRKILIDVKSGCYNGSIHHNRLNTTHETPFSGAIPGIYIDAFDKTCKDISIYNNVIWGNGTGIQTSTEQGGTLENIYIFNNICNGSGSGYQVNNHTENNPGGSNHSKWNLSIINNHFIGNNICVQLTDINSSFHNFTLRNNIFKGNVGINIGSDLDLNYHNIDHNLFDISDYSNYYGMNCINASPLLVDPYNGDYSLSPESPAIDNGSSISAPSLDFNGIDRTQQTYIDIGAFELIQTSDETSPEISNIVTISSDPLDTNSTFGWVNVSCEVTDNIAIQEVRINITNPDGSHTNQTMIPFGTSTYYYNSSLTFSYYGNYSYFIWSIDTNQNAQTSNNFDFSMPPNWDVNNDGKGDILDFTLISNCYDQNGNPGWIREDVDNNGIISILDMIYVSNHYGEIW